MAANSDKKIPAVGIDLGTTYSCVAVWNAANARVDIIANDLGQRTTPSYVGFTSEERLVGQAAKNQAARNPANTVFDAKRLIGRRFSEETVQKDLKLWPFKIIRGDNDKPLIEVQYKNETKQFSAEEISAAVLQKMKKTAEDWLGGDVKDAVITCPAYFNSSQRQATKDAGKIAGLNVLRVINEPTAAALAYGLDKVNQDIEQNIVVFDFGGGTLDVSAVQISNGVFEVKATGGDTHLGGEDIDNILVNHFAREFRRKSKLDITKSQRALRRLRTACEKAKRMLSSSFEAQIEIDSLFEGEDFFSKISRARFNELCNETFVRVLQPINQVLRDAQLTKEDIHEVVLVGGSTKIVQLQRMISDFFNGKKLNKGVNPDEAVAYGAAIQASILGGTATGNANECLLIDVVPLSLGVEASGGKFVPIIDRNTAVPCKKSKTFSTNRDNQSSVTVNIYQGERVSTRDNHLLGTFKVCDIPAMKRGVPKIEVIFDVNSDSILSVTAEEKVSSKKASITITNTEALSKDQIEKMLDNAKKFAEIDAHNQEIKKWLNTIENFAYNMKSKIQDTTPDARNGATFADELTDQEKQTLTKTAEETLNWVYDNDDCNDLELLKKKQSTIESIYGGIVDDVNQRMKENYEKERQNSSTSENKDNDMTDDQNQQTQSGEQKEPEIDLD